MSVLDAAVASRMRAACRERDLCHRNWSNPGDWMFAIYTLDDSFVGTVRVVLEPDQPCRATMRVDERRICGPTKRERATLESLCAEFNRRGAS